MLRYTNTTQDPFEFIKTVKKRYRRGLSLVAPDFSDRPLSPEDLLNQEVSLGPCDDPLVLALVASRDPMVTMSMAAASRLSPHAVEHRLLAGVFSIVGEVSKHQEVKECIDVVVRNNFDTESVPLLKQRVVGEIYKKRAYYRTLIYNNLRGLIEGAISPDRFIGQFFVGMNQLNLKTGPYTRMVVDFLLSPKFRPKVKFLMLENFYQLPRDVRMQVMMGICNAPKGGHNEAIRDELICILQEEPALLAEPANNISGVQKQFFRPYPRSSRQLLQDMDDNVFKTAERILA